MREIERLSHKGIEFVLYIYPKNFIRYVPAFVCNYFFDIKKKGKQPKRVFLPRDCTAEGFGKPEKNYISVRTRNGELKYHFNGEPVS